MLTLCTEQNSYLPATTAPDYGSIGHVKMISYPNNQTNSLHEQFLYIIECGRYWFYDISYGVLHISEPYNFRQTRAAQRLLLHHTFIILRLKQIKQPFQSIAHFFSVNIYVSPYLSMISHAVAIVRKVDNGVLHLPGV